MRAQKMEICSGLPLLSMRLTLVFILIFMLLIFSKWYAVNAYCSYHQKKKELVLKKNTTTKKGGKTEALPNSAFHCGQPGSGGFNGDMDAQFAIRRQTWHQ